MIRILPPAPLPSPLIVEFLVLTLLAIGLLHPAAMDAQETNGPTEQILLGVDPAQVLGAPLGRPLEGEELEAATLSVGSVVRCPVCQGMPISASPSSSALAMRDQAQELLERGYSPDQVLSYFESTYGEFVLLNPKKTGANLVVWIAPLLGVALGLLALVSYLRKEGSGQEDDELNELAAYQERVRSEVQSVELNTETS